MIRCRGATVTLGDRRVLDGVDLAVGRGEWVSIVGPNGAGKSTLLRYLTGAVGGDGDVHLGGRPFGALGRRERALLVALVPQSPVIPLGMRVLDYVLLGRTPHIRPLGVETAAWVPIRDSAATGVGVVLLGRCSRVPPTR